MYNLVYNIARTLDSPPNNKPFWRFLHVCFVFFSSLIGKAYFGRLKKKYPSQSVVLFEQSSIGDILLTNRYYNNFKETENLQNEIILFDKRLKRVVSLFPYSNPVFISPFIIYSLSQYQLIAHDEIVPYNTWLFFNQEYLYSFKLNAPPENLINCEIGYDFPSGKTALLSPYEKTLSFSNGEKLPEEFWAELARELSRNGYNVITNCAGTEEEPPVDSTKQVFPRFEEIVSFCNKCDCVISMRSGFADFSALSDKCKLAVLYPDDEWLKKFSIKKLWQKNDCLEIVYRNQSISSIIEQIKAYIFEEEK